tara:strand:+ start:322 stop:459 length:138 start_codon:yes stop_codon:yes gene_type:complete
LSLVTRTTNSADYRDIDGRVLAARMREQTVAGVKERYIEQFSNHL